MKHLARRTLALLSAGVLSVSACSDSSTGPTPNSTMTPQEALAVASGIMAQISPAQASASGTGTVTFTSDCAQGGKVSGSVSSTNTLNTAGTGSIAASMTVTPQACKVSNGTKLITVGGQWTFDFSMTLNRNELVSDYVSHGKGNLTWDDGNCNMDFTVTTSLTSHRSVVTGTFCGATLNSTV